MILNEQEAHDQACKLALPELVKSLEADFGRRLVALIAGVSDAKAVAEWSQDGGRKPRQPAELRLRTAYRVVYMLKQVESIETVRAWLLGMNPDLDDQAPALVLRERPDEVIRAARDFVAYG